MIAVSVMRFFEIVKRSELILDRLCWLVFEALQAKESFHVYGFLSLWKLNLKVYGVLQLKPNRWLLFKLV